MRLQGRVGNDRLALSTARGWKVQQKQRRRRRTAESYTKVS